jgi:integral membrane protein
MEWMLVWRFGKWLGLVLWAIGVYQTATQSKVSKRLNALYTLTIPGFAMTWMMGWLMMKNLGHSMSTSWISNAMLFGLISMSGSFLRAFWASRASLYIGMGIVGFTVSIAAMVVRGENTTTLGVVYALAVLFGGILVWRLPSTEEADSEVKTMAQVIKGFQWVARAEGLTVLVLFLLYLPAKKLLDINLDGGTGVIGWTHGVFVILYVMSLTMTSRTLEWSWGRYIIGGVSSFFPFGTFIFEHNVFKELETSDKSKTVR